MDTQKTKVVICGGGNGSHASVATIGSKPQFQVHIFTRRPTEWKSKVVGTTKGSIWEDRGDFNGHIQLASNNPADFGKGVRVWLISGPANIHLTLLQ